MFLEKHHLDLVLVPTGLLFMLVYHVYLLYRIIKHPNTTVMGFENGNRRIWVRRMMEDMPSNTGLALQVISSNLSASAYMVAISITLSSIVGTIVGNASYQIHSKRLAKEIIYGDTSAESSSIKYASLLVCFLVAFMSHVQSIRYYIHINFLISTPGSSVPVAYVEKSVVRGSNFWSLGLRAYYFAFPLLLWIFGPIPMFASSLGMVSFLYFLDSTADAIPHFQIKQYKKHAYTQGIEMIASNSGHQSLGSLLFGAGLDLQAVNSLYP
eukprot:Gb_38230 [translate_table: standard]